MAITKKIFNPKIQKKKILKSNLNLLQFSANFDRFFSFKNLSSSIEKEWNYRLSIKITSNNVFCTLVNFKDLKTIVQLSSGKCNIACSKKLLKFSSKIVLDTFFQNSKKFLENQNIVFKFSGPLRLRRFVLNQVFYNLKNAKVSKLFFDIKPKKCFNGCRPPKLKRKKNKGLRIFK